MEKLDLEFYIGVNFSTKTYAVCDKKSALAYEKIIDVSRDLLLIPHFWSLSVEKGACVKAIWIAKTIKDYLNVKELNLILKSDYRALKKTPEQLTEYTNKYANENGINLSICWIEEGQTNLAIKYTWYGKNRAGGFLYQNFDVKKYCQENNLNNNDNKDVPVLTNASDNTEFKNKTE